MTVNIRPKLLTEEFFPGLNDQHVVGAAGAGIQVVDTTFQAGTVKTNAELVAAPNNLSGITYGPVLHSLGIAPTFAFAQALGDVGAGGHAVTFAYVTADASAVYIRARAWSLLTTAVATRIVVMR